LRGGLGHPLDRTDTEVDDPPTDHAEGGEDRQRSDHFDQDQPRDRALDVVERQGGDGRHLAVALGEHAVGPTALGGVDGERSTIGCRAILGRHIRRGVLVVADVRREHGDEVAVRVEIPLVGVTRALRTTAGRSAGGPS
jgi:hypothetical protein